MITATTPAVVFNVNPDLAAAYARRCLSGTFSSDHLGESVQLPASWNPRHPDADLDQLPELIEEAQACGALTSTVPGCKASLDLYEDGNGAWYLWRFTLPGGHPAVSFPQWARVQDIGPAGNAGEDAITGILHEAAAKGNYLLATVLTAFTPGRALILPCPPGVTPAELLKDLIDMGGEAVEYRTPDIADYCGGCEKTEKDGVVTDIVFCGDHAEDDENARIYAQVKAHLERVQAGEL